MRTQFEKKSALQNAEKMIQASNFFHYDALNFGNLDRSLPQDDLQKIFGNSQFPWLASNVFPSSRFGATFKRRLPLKLKNSDVLLLGLSSISEGDGNQGWRSEDPHNVLLTELKNTPATTLPIVLSDLDVNELMKIAADMKRPIIFLGSREMGGWDRPLEIGQALLLHLRHQGQDWGVLKVPTKWDNKQGWYNPSETEILAKRWNDLKEESLKLRELASSSEKSVEIKNLETKLLNDGIKALVVDLFELSCSIIETNICLEKMFEVEVKKDKDKFKRALQSTVNIHDRLIPEVIKLVSVTNPKMLFIKGVGAVYPFIRSHTVLNNLQSAVKDIPTVMFFSGAYSGQSLNLFGLMKDDNYYRAFNIDNYKL
jgi:hypothetical protein